MNEEIIQALAKSHGLFAANVKDELNRNLYPASKVAESPPEPSTNCCLLL